MSDIDTARGSDSRGPCLFVGGPGGLNMIGHGTESRLVIYWWSPSLLDAFGEDKWQITLLSDLIAGAPRPSSELAGVSAGDNISIASCTEDGAIGRYHWSVGGESAFEMCARR